MNSVKDIQAFYCYMKVYSFDDVLYCFSTSLSWSNRFIVSLDWLLVNHMQTNISLHLLDKHHFLFPFNNGLVDI